MSENYQINLNKNFPQAKALELTSLLTGSLLNEINSTNAKLIKKDDGSLVYLFPAEIPKNNKQWLIKIYHRQGAKKIFSMLPVKSRAEKSFIVSEQLRTTPVSFVPVIAWGRYKKDKEHYNFSIQEYLVGAQSMWTLTETQLIPKAMLANAILLLHSLHDAGFIHGDAKWHNLLATKNEDVYFVDLDGCNKSTDEELVARDVARFLIDAGIRKVDDISALLQAYLSMPGTDGKLLKPLIEKSFRKLAERHVQRYGRTNLRGVANEIF